MNRSPSLRIALSHESESSRGESPRLLDHPYITASRIENVLGGPRTTAYSLIDTLQNDDVLAAAPSHVRTKLYVATDIFDLLEKRPQEIEGTYYRTAAFNPAPRSGTWNQRQSRAIESASASIVTPEFPRPIIYPSLMTQRG